MVTIDLMTYFGSPIGTSSQNRLLYINFSVLLQNVAPALPLLVDGLRLESPYENMLGQSNEVQGENIRESQWPSSEIRSVSKRQISFKKLEAALRHEADQEAFRSIISNLTESLKKRALEDGEGMQLSEGNILYSLPNGNKQAWHRDFPELNYTAPPRVYLIPISNTARLDICKNLLQHPNDNEIVTSYGLKRGDVFSFHGYLPHRGCSYSKDNFRIHFYSLHRDDLHLLPEIEKHSEIYSGVVDVERKKGRPRNQGSFR